MLESMARKDTEVEAGPTQPEEQEGAQVLPESESDDDDGGRQIRAQKAGERDKLADQRDAVADDRDRLADERERLADDREFAADKREQAADRREAAQDRRQREADQRERWLDERGRILGLVGESLEQRSLETIERARELLELSGRRLDRQEERVRREQAGQARQQAAVDRALTEGERTEAALLPDPREQIERAKVLRKHAVNAIEVFAASEEEAARILEQLAEVSPERRTELLAAANRARSAASTAREVVRTFAE